MWGCTHHSLSGIIFNFHQRKMCQLLKFRISFTDKVLGLIALLATFYVDKCKWQENAPNLNVFSQNP